MKPSEMATMMKPLPPAAGFPPKPTAPPRPTTTTEAKPCPEKDYPMICSS